ncbi:oligopeptide ABC transporter substrate-binding protein [Lacticaseibacillus yichunensis]|uniref:Oligopeptide ABC transporter substrate-binding protein n=1 Tax=Lacticaseibacillus yichunensis TaxID=2486015 RepID=A0ABW4CM25_9LACO
MNKAKVIGTLMFTSIAAVTLAACGSNSSSSKKTTSSNADTSKIKPYTTNNKKSVSGATFKYGEQSASPFTGIFSNELSVDAVDSDVIQFANEGLFKVDDSYAFVKGGAADIKLDDDAKTATITINPKVKWSDGKSLVAKDVEYAYEIIANKGTQSQRYTESLQNIVGMAEYHAGTAKTISGIEMPDGDNGLKVVIHFKQMKPGMNTSGNGFIWESAVPYHYLKGIAFNKLISSDQIRKNPIFYGPYKMTKLVSGQSAEFVPNEYYYGKKPQLAKITFEVVSPNQAPTAAAAAKYDMLAIGPTSYAKFKDSDKVTVIGKDPLSYSYMGFKVGKWDSKTGKNVMNKDAKMNNKSLRLAIAYAMNVKGVAEKLYPDTGSQLATLIPPAFGKWSDSSIKAYPYSLKKAEDLLDKAGYKKGKDGYRTNPDGSKLTINWATISGNQNTELMNKTYMQAWKKIGLHVVYTGGKPMDANAWQDAVMNDASNVDMYDSGWSMSSEPSQDDLYSEAAPFNWERFVTAKNTELLKNMNSDKAFDTDYRIDQFHQWQQYMHDEAYVIPTLYIKNLYAVTNRVKGLSLEPTSSWADVSVTSK